MHKNWYLVNIAVIFFSNHPQLKGTVGYLASWDFRVRIEQEHMLCRHYCPFPCQFCESQIRHNKTYYFADNLFYPLSILRKLRSSKKLFIADNFFHFPMKSPHCKFFQGEFYRFFLCNFSHYSLTMIFTEKDFETNHLKIYENYLLIP